MGMSKDEADARVAQAHSLRDRLDSAKSITEFRAITEEYEKTMGYPMIFRVDQYDELMNKATPEEIDALWAERKTNED